MNKLLKKDKTSTSNKSISWVLMRSYLLTMSISLAFGILVFDFVLKQEVNYKFQMSDTQALNTFSYFITRQLTENERISSELVTNEMLQQALKETLRNSTVGVKKILNESIIGRESVKSVHIADKKGHVISEYKYPVYLKDDKAFLAQFNLKAIDNREGASYWGIGGNVLEGDAKPTLYMARVIRAKGTLEPLGYLFIYLDNTAFQRECMEILENIQLQVMIKDSEGKILSMPEQSELSKLQEHINWENSKYQKIQYQHKKYFYISRPMRILGGEIVGMNNQVRINDNISIILIFAAIMNIIFIIAASLVVKRKVISPLKYIAAKARTIGKEGKLDIKFSTEEGYTEVYDIIQALYEMMKEINTLITEVEEREKFQKRLELSVINHQVKPHFLYNTLNAASILVAIEEKESANELIKTLAKYYRACLSSGEDTITVEEELQIVKEYIKIAVIRNPNIVEIAYDVDEDTLKLKIPKITLQSLVENSIKYGIKEVGKPVNIRVIIKLDRVDEKKYIKIVVEDDGVGMQPEVIDKVMRGEKLNVKSGFGLSAVIKRIQLCYDLKDAKDVIEVDSKGNEYTKIILKIPC